MAKCVRLYEAIAADVPLLAEVTRFEAATKGRLGLVGRHALDQMHGEERKVAWMQGVLVGARAIREWYPVLLQHLDSHPALKARVDHAEFMLNLHANRRRPGVDCGLDPKPAPRPSFGPGM